MYDLKQSLIYSGYKGPCENINILKWAIRAGASSQFFLDLITWIEEQLEKTVYCQQVLNNIRCLFSMMRHSILMKSSYGSETSINPKEFRLQTLKVLIRQLQLRKLPKRILLEGCENLQKNSKDLQDFKHLIITLNLNRTLNSGEWSQRQVHFRTNFLEI